MSDIRSPWDLIDLLLFYTGCLRMFHMRTTFSTPEEPVQRMFCLRCGARWRESEDGDPGRIPVVDQMSGK